MEYKAVIKDQVQPPKCKVQLHAQYVFIIFVKMGGKESRYDFVCLCTEKDTRNHLREGKQQATVQGTGLFIYTDVEGWK